MDQSKLPQDEDNTTLINDDTPSEDPYAWSRDDDAALEDIVSNEYQFRPKPWEKIAKQLNRGKIAEECQDRWETFLKPGAREGPFSHEEDKIIKDFIALSGEEIFTGWTKLKKRLPGRKVSDVRARWLEVLNPAIKREPFSEEEYVKLWEGYQSLKRNFSDISFNYFKWTRPPQMLNRHFKSLAFKEFAERKYGKAAYAKSQPPTPVLRPGVKEALELARKRRLEGERGTTNEDDCPSKKKGTKTSRKKDKVAKEASLGKSGQKCHERLEKSSKPRPGRTTFSREEDELIKKIILDSGEIPYKRWTDLAEQLPGRSGSQLRKRWVNVLDPSLSCNSFSEEEDMTLWLGYRLLGKKFSKISTSHFQSTRSAHCLRKRLHSPAFREFIEKKYDPEMYACTIGREETPSDGKKENEAKKPEEKRQEINHESVHSPHKKPDAVSSSNEPDIQRIDIEPDTVTSSVKQTIQPEQNQQATRHSASTKKTKIFVPVVSQTTIVFSSDIDPAHRPHYTSGILHFHPQGTTTGGHCFLWVADKKFMDIAVAYVSKFGPFDEHHVEFIPFSTRANWIRSYPHATPFFECDHFGRIIHVLPYPQYPGYPSPPMYYHNARYL